MPAVSVKSATVAPEPDDLPVAGSVFVGDTLAGEHHSDIDAWGHNVDKGSRAIDDRASIVDNREATFFDVDHGGNTAHSATDGTAAARLTVGDW